MDHYQYIIIGAGMTADAAVRGIRQLDSDGRIAMIGDEQDPPYQRPPLSKGLWQGKSVNSIWRKTEEREVALMLGRRAVSIDVQQKTVQDDRGEVYAYDKLLLATGGTPRRLPFGGEDIVYFRTLEDFRRLQELVKQHDRFAVIGGGFIGSEIAAALATSGKKVMMVFPEEGIGGRIFPRDLSRFITEYYRGKGVEVLPEESVQDIQIDKGAFQLETDRGIQPPVDGVIAGIGILPNVDLAESAGLEVDNGILVDEMLQTSQADIYSAGDVAEFHQPALGKRLRVEHEDNANTMGTQAGRNMANAGEAYHHLPYFYSDLFDLGYEAVGELDARMETLEDWKEPYKEGVVYYLEGGRVRGVLLWNVWGKLDAARDLIADAGPIQPADLKGRITS